MGVGVRSKEERQREESGLPQISSLDDGVGIVLTGENEDRIKAMHTREGRHGRPLPFPTTKFPVLQFSGK